MKLGFILVLFIGLVHTLNAQQNLFNIPSGEVTPKKRFFYQHQLNFYSANQLETKSHLVYGLGHDWDIGINFIDLPLRIGNGNLLSYNDDSNRKPLYPLVLATVQKQWFLGKKFQFNVGSQMGINIASDFDTKRFAFLGYALVKWKPDKRSYLVGGPYLGNDVFVGGPPKLRPGYMLGYEFKLSKRWLLMGDLVSGNHKKAQTVLGAGYNLSKRVQIFAGALLNFPNRKLQEGLVIEINWYGWNFMDSNSH